MLGLISEHSYLKSSSEVLFMVVAYCCCNLQTYFRTKCLEAIGSLSFFYVTCLSSPLKCWPIHNLSYFGNYGIY
jgi:hypothetical protein